jgi:hypothetical protein
MSNGSHRIPRPTRPQDLADVRAAAQDIAQQAEHAGRAGRCYPPSWVTDEAKWEKAKEVAKKSDCDDYYACITAI